MSNALWKTRQVKNSLAKALSLFTAAFGLFWLVWILWTTLKNGLPALHLNLLTQMTPPPGETGGLLNAIFGSIFMSAIAVLIGTPVGIAAGTYLSEYARESKLGFCIRFINDILLSYGNRLFYHTHESKLQNISSLGPDAVVAVCITYCSCLSTFYGYRYTWQCFITRVGNGSSNVDCLCM